MEFPRIWNERIGQRLAGSLKCWERNFTSRKYKENLFRWLENKFVPCFLCLDSDHQSGQYAKLQTHSRLIVSTAQVLFHRFFANQSFHRHDRFIVAVAALFLASKVEEAFYFRLPHIVKAYIPVRRIFMDSSSSGYLSEAVR